MALIRVVDNGCGIEADGAGAGLSRATPPASCRPTPTWTHIATLGFRGEALPSIAAVAEVEAVSRAGGRRRRRRGCGWSFGDGRGVGARRAAPPGTSISVRGLFREQPARLKFLRSAGVGGGARSRRGQPLRAGLPGGGVLADGSTGARRSRPAAAASRREAVAGVYGARYGGGDARGRRRVRGHRAGGAVRAAAPVARQPQLRHHLHQPPLGAQPLPGLRRRGGLSRACCRPGASRSPSSTCACRRRRSTSTCTRRRRRCGCATSGACSRWCSGRFAAALAGWRRAGYDAAPAGRGPRRVGGGAEPEFAPAVRPEPAQSQLLRDGRARRRCRRDVRGCRSAAAGPGRHDLHHRRGAGGPLPHRPARGA